MFRTWALFVFVLVLSSCNAHTAPNASSPERQPESGGSQPPSEAQLRQQFVEHKADFVRLATLLSGDHHAEFVDDNGQVSIGGTLMRAVPEYRHLMESIAAQDVMVREDGSMEFALWGSGCVICSDSYMGVRYLPKNHSAELPGWMPIQVASLKSERLPKENRRIANGLYVVPIDSEWFVYRREIQE